MLDNFINPHNNSVLWSESYNPKKYESEKLNNLPKFKQMPSDSMEIWAHRTVPGSALRALGSSTGAVLLDLLVLKAQFIILNFQETMTQFLCKV